MAKPWLPLLTLVAALGSALIAGTFFAFSSFVMKSLSRLPAEQGISAMQSINIVIIPSAFMPVFLGTALICLVLGVAACFRLNEPRGVYLLVGCLCYLLGAIGVTMVCNVPLNDALAAAPPSSAPAAELWKPYLSNWTLWNHIRTLASLAATTCFFLSR